MIDGSRIAVPDGFHRITTYVLFEQQDWFEDEIRFVRRMLHPGMRVVDVGANFGVYTIAMAKAVGSQGRVWAVEPTAETADFLESSCALNEFMHVEVLRCALSSQPGSAFLAHGQSPELNRLDPTGQPRDGERVAVETLDRIAAARGMSQIDFVKLDAEGQEERILEGGRDFFERESPLLMCELRDGEGVHHGLLGTCEAKGYLSYRLLPGLNVLAPLSIEAVDGWVLNFFACRPERARALEAEGLLAAHPQTVREDQITLSDAPWKSIPALRELRFSQRVAVARSEHREYLRGLRLYFVARDASQPSSWRAQALAASVRRLREAWSSMPTAARASTLARALADSGDRTNAVRCCIEACQRSQTDADLGDDEPFLPACPRYESLEPRPDPRQWVMAAGLEQAIRLGTYSSVFGTPASARDLDFLCGSRFTCEEFERRRYLLGLQAKQ
jgi:FkbM family methyltransferase